MLQPEYSITFVYVKHGSRDATGREGSEGESSHSVGLSHRESRSNGVVARFRRRFTFSSCCCIDSLLCGLTLAWLLLLRVDAASTS